MDVLETGSPQSPGHPPAHDLARYPGAAQNGGRSFAARALNGGALTRGPLAVARAVTAAAVVALLAAEILPWATLSVRDSTTDGDPIGVDPPTAGLRLHLLELPTAVTLLFHAGVLLLLPLLAVVTFGPDRLRRPLGTAAAGVAVAQIVFMAAIIGATSGRNGVANLYASTFGADSGLAGSRGAGIFCGALAAVLALVGAVLAARVPVAAPVPTVFGWPGAYPPPLPAGAPPAPPVTTPGPAAAPAHAPGADGWRRPAGGDYPDQPLDLTVTPLPSTSHQVYLRPEQ